MEDVKKMWEKNFDVQIYKATHEEIVKRAFDTTVHGVDTKVSKEQAYASEHSPIRAQMYMLHFTSVPVFASTHYIRHNIGIVHWAKTFRDDRFDGEDFGRWQPTDHAMLLNAQSFIAIARARMCLKAHGVVRGIFDQVRKELMDVDPDLVPFLVPNCVYRGGICKERSWGCGCKTAVMNKYSYYRGLFE